ncbi:MAG: NmrA-like family [Gemmatimonadetes bacterium]|nr:NmrA-like family [Gemmatimonadota bacterium]
MRAASLVLLSWMLWLSLDRSRAPEVRSTDSAGLPRALVAWSTEAVAPVAIHVRLDSTPAPRHRDWLAALGAAGSTVSWSGALPSLGIAVQPVAAPRGGLIVRASAADGATLALSDALGALDTARARDGGARFSLASASGAIVVHSGGSRALAQLPDSARLHRVLVIADAGWESKFVVAALEEDGWKVDAELRVAPGVNVTQGSAGAIDTSRYSAVIALDAAVAPRATELARYVAEGGGLILAGDAASVAALAPLRAGGTGRVEPAPHIGAEAGAVTLRSLAVFPVTGLKSDAVALERRDGVVTMAARRYVAGRVLQIGYADTWRWRMSGGETSVADHRAWWTRAVSSVAYTARDAQHDGLISDDDAANSAPLATLVEALGAPSARPSAAVGPASGTDLRRWLFALLMFCLLAEWASRRLRGSR